LDELTRFRCGWLLAGLAVGLAIAIVLLLTLKLLA